MTSKRSPGGEYEIHKRPPNKSIMYIKLTTAIYNLLICLNLKAYKQISKY